MLTGVLSVLSSLLGFGKALLGLQQAAQVKQAGVNEQQLADQQKDIGALKAEQGAAAQPVDPAADLKAGKF